MIVPALSLWQPWASALAVGAKQHETRAWRPRSLRPGSLLAVHAARRCGDVESFETEECVQLLRDATVPPAVVDQVARWLTLDVWVDDLTDVVRAAGMPLGAVVGVVRYLGAFPTRQLRAEQRPEELRLGDWSDGRWAWRCEPVDYFAEGVPCRGGRGLFEWTPPPWVVELCPYLGPASEVTECPLSPESAQARLPLA